ncbi:cytochrome P450 9e2-like isoform X2 [Andrena cerasifolii]|uniref:cytochrome P450 9e2-like isoform X2 n=1 Tax=Andrena cerasifolii TaxID=2819439 RepID=UPI004037CD11
MDLFTGALIAVIVILLLYYFLWSRMTYFKDLGIPHEPPIPILGNVARVVFQQTSMAEHLQRAYNLYPEHRYFGFYNFETPVIVIRDPELITAIAVKHFDQFTDHRGFVDEDLDPLMGKNLFSLRGDRWREMRRLLSPAFTSSKMKTMFPLMCDCAVNFAEYIAMESKQGKVYDMKAIFGRYTTDVIASCSFGISADSMKNPNNEFYMFAKETINFISGLSLKFLMGKNFPTISKLFGIRLFGDKPRRYFRGIVADAVKMREEKGIYRPDMIQLMMETRDKDGGGLTIDEMTYQAFVFFLAGYDTTSSFLCFAAHQIGVMPEVQAKLRAEIEEVVRKTDGKPTYEAIKDMQYMEAVLNETLRLYAIVSFLDRVCVKEFQLPPATPDSKPVTIKPGGVVWFLPFALQRDPAYFSDPLKFKPERFLNGEVSAPNYTPFGVGPRLCIGNRFALMESKVVLFHLLWRCDLEPSADTAVPMKLNKKSFVLAAENGFWMNFRTREQEKVVS